MQQVAFAAGKCAKGLCPRLDRSKFIVMGSEMFFRSFKYRKYWKNKERYKLIEVGEKVKPAIRGFVVYDDQEDVVVRLDQSIYEDVIDKMLKSNVEIVDTSTTGRMFDESMEMPAFIIEKVEGRLSCRPKLINEDIQEDHIGFQTSLMIYPEFPDAEIIFLTTTKEAEDTLKNKLQKKKLHMAILGSFGVHAETTVNQLFFKLYKYRKYWINKDHYKLHDVGERDKYAVNGLMIYDTSLEVLIILDQAIYGQVINKMVKFGAVIQRGSFLKRYYDETLLFPPFIIEKVEGRLHSRKMQEGEVIPDEKISLHVSMDTLLSDWPNFDIIFLISREEAELELQLPQFLYVAIFESLGD